MIRAGVDLTINSYAVSAWENRIAQNTLGRKNIAIYSYVIEFKEAIENENVIIFGCWKKNETEEFLPLKITTLNCDYYS